MMHPIILPISNAAAMNLVPFEFSDKVVSTMRDLAPLEKLSDSNACRTWQIPFTDHAANRCRLELTANYINGEWSCRFWRADRVVSLEQINRIPRKNLQIVKISFRDSQVRLDADLSRDLLRDACQFTVPFLNNAKLWLDSDAPAEISELLPFYNSYAFREIVVFKNNKSSVEFLRNQFAFGVLQNIFFSKDFPLSLENEYLKWVADDRLKKWTKNIVVCDKNSTSQLQTCKNDGFFLLEIAFVVTFAVHVLLWFLHQ